MDDQWSDPDAPWFAKLRRAAVHIDEAQRLLGLFRESEPWRVSRELGRGSGEWRYVLRDSVPVPVDAICVIGDAIHSLRSCLDSMAYGLAVEYLDRPLSAIEERFPEFPILMDEVRFEDWLNAKRSGIKRADLFGPRQIEALKCVQPFAFRQDANSLGVYPDVSAEMEFRHDGLRRLDDLWNIDKHRRLPLVVLGLGIVYWSGSANFRWAENPEARRGLTEGDTLGVLRALDGAAEPPPTLVAEIQICLGDDVLRGDVVSQLKQWHFSIAGWVIPRMVAMARGAPKRPMVISLR